MPCSLDGKVSVVHCPQHLTYVWTQSLLARLVLVNPRTLFRCFVCLDMLLKSS